MACPGPAPAPRRARPPAPRGSHLSNTTCLIRPHLFYVCFLCVKDHSLLNDLPLLKKAQVGQVVLDKRLPLSTCAQEGLGSRPEYAPGSGGLLSTVVYVL